NARRQVPFRVGARCGLPSRRHPVVRRASGDWLLKTDVPPPVAALAGRRPTMYTYIVQRTQIYLSEDETRALDREVQATGKTRSRLIREAISDRYGARSDAQAIVTALEETAGAWRGRRETGADTVDRLRSGRRLARLRRRAATGR